MERFSGRPTFCPILDGHLERDFDGRRAVIGKEDVLEISGQNPSQAAAQILDGIVREPGQQNVVHFGCLFRDGGDDRRVAVSVEIHPPRRNAVD